MATTYTEPPTVVDTTRRMVGITTKYHVFERRRLGEQ